jgi:hypothetical protein
MSGRNELARLAAARPALLDHTEQIVDADLEHRIFRHIVSSGPLGDAPFVARRRRGRAGSLRLAAAVIAGAAAATLAVFAGVRGPGAPGQHDAGSGSAVGGAARPGRVISARTMADRTITALAASSRADIMYSRTVFASGVAGSTATIEDWSYGISERTRWFSPRGSLTFDGSAVVSHGLRVRRFVDYTSRTWQQDSIAAAHYGPGPGLSEEVDGLLGVGPSGRHFAPLPGLRHRPPAPRNVISIVNVNGRRMFQVLIRWTAQSFMAEPWPLPMFVNSMVDPGSTVGRVSSEAVWIDAATYLPVRVAVTAPGGRVLMSQTLAWLPRDRANLAELTPAPVPAGFRETQELAH